MNIEEFANLMKNGEEIPTKKIHKVKRFVGRKFMLTPYRMHMVRGRVYSKRMPSIEVSSHTKKRVIADLKRNGYGRVDCVEIETTVQEQVNTVSINNYTVKSTRNIQRRKMEFTQQIFSAARDKFIPKSIEVLPVSAAQTTIPWELIEKSEDAYLSNRPVSKVADRNAKRRAENKRYALFNKLNKEINEADRMAIFDRKSGGFLFASIYEDEILAFINDNELALEDIILYVPNDIYWMLREME